MSVSGKIIAFTGHRPDKLLGYEAEIRLSIDSLLDEIAPSKCIVGMARGVDMIAARASYEKHIPYIAAIPFMGQAIQYPDDEKDEYLFLVKNALHIEVLNDCYLPWAFQQRNEWMVDNCNLVIAVWDGTRGGTANCIKYCRSKRVKREIRFLSWTRGVSG